MKWNEESAVAFAVAGIALAVLAIIIATDHDRTPRTNTIQEATNAR